MSDRVIFFNGFVGRTAKDSKRIIAERITATMNRFLEREELTPADDHIKKVIVVGEENGRLSATDIMSHLSARGIPVDQLEIAGDARDTFHAIRLFLAKAAALYPDQHLRVHIATHRWLLERTVYYMRRCHYPDDDHAPFLKARGCCPVAGYEPSWWERVRECFRQSDARQAIAMQSLSPLEWQMMQRQLEFN